MNTKTKLFKTVSILLFIIAVLHLVGVKFYLDWTYWWYDMLLHFLSGGVVGLASLWVIKTFFNSDLWSKPRIIIWALVSVFTVGVLWEVFELYVGFTLLEDGMEYVSDTLSDICLDLAGGFIGLACGFGLKDE